MKFLRLLVLFLALPLLGFSDSASFDRPTNYGGAGGYTFTGSPANHGMTCTECHETLREPKVQIESDPPGLFENGYESNTRYRVFVDLLFETRGLEHNGQCGQGNAACNRNLFVAEFVDLTGATSGILCPDTDAILGDKCASDHGELTTRTPNGKAIAGQSLTYPAVCGDSLDERSDCIDVEGLAEEGLSPSEIAKMVLAEVRGRTHWEFSWRSPIVGTSPVRMYLGLVDGDGGTRWDSDYADYYGDAVYMTARLIPRSDTPVTNAATSKDGCSSSTSIPGVMFVLLAYLLVRRRALG